MSVDGKMCRVCLAPQKTSRFNLIFGNNGKIAKQINALTGLKILEFRSCPALICPKCTGNLLRAFELRDSILENNKHFNEIYKICRFAEFDIDFTVEVLSDQSEEWEEEEKEENIEIKTEPNSSLELPVSGVVENYQPQSSEDFIAEEEIKTEPNYDSHFTTETIIFENPSTDIKTEIKEEPFEFQECVQEFQFDDLPEELLLALDGDNSEEVDDEECDEYLDEVVQSTSQQSRKRGRKDNSQSFSCTICGFKTCSELDRQEHLATVHNQKKMKRSHSHVVSEKEWMCSYCGKKFKTKFDRTQHRKNEHLEEEKSLTCRFCQKQFTSSLHLRIHIKYTHLETCFICPKCGTQFENPETFKAHMMMENNERDFICEVCSASFILKHQLTNHMRKHNEDRRYACEHCGLMFSTQTMLKSHFNSVHLQIKQSFRCGTCHQSFALIHHLKGHLSRGNCSVESRFASKT